MSKEPETRAGSKELRKNFALRLSAPVFDALQGWADDELRSLNAQIEYVLRDALRRSGRWRAEADNPPK
jgi:hypothetical protein